MTRLKVDPSKLVSAEESARIDRQIHAARVVLLALPSMVLVILIALAWQHTAREEWALAALCGAGFVVQLTLLALLWRWAPRPTSLWARMRFFLRGSDQ